MPFRVRDGKDHPYVKEFLTAALDSPVLLNAVLYASLVKADHRPDEIDCRRRSLQHRAKATELLLASFTDPVKGTSDEAIAAVTVLATFDASHCIHADSSETDSSHSL